MTTSTDVRRPAPSEPGRTASTRGAARIALPARPPAVAKARAFVRACCQVDALPRSVSEIAVLLTSEAVTQAVTSGRDRVSVTFTADASGAGVLVEVTEPGVHRPRTEALTSAGTAVLDAFAHAWGVRRDGSATTLWFRVVESFPFPRTPIS